MQDMAKMPKELINLLNEPVVPKVLATCDAAGRLSVVPKVTLTAVDEETVAFGDIRGDKANENLKANNKTAVTVFKKELHPVGYQVKGTFQGFQTSGPLFNKFAKRIKERFNLDIRAVDVIKVDEVYSAAPPNWGKKLA